jgi:hypothetical protein
MSNFLPIFFDADQNRFVLDLDRDVFDTIQEIFFNAEELIDREFSTITGIDYDEIFDFRDRYLLEFKGEPICIKARDLLLVQKVLIPDAYHASDLKFKNLVKDSDCLVEIRNQMNKLFSALRIHIK